MKTESRSAWPVAAAVVVWGLAACQPPPPEPEEPEPPVGIAAAEQDREAASDAPQPGDADATTEVPVAPAEAGDPELEPDSPEPETSQPTQAPAEVGEPEPEPGAPEPETAPPTSAPAEAGDPELEPGAPEAETAPPTSAPPEAGDPELEPDAPEAETAPPTSAPPEAGDPELEPDAPEAETAPPTPAQPEPGEPADESESEATADQPAATDPADATEPQPETDAPGDEAGASPNEAETPVVPQADAEPDPGPTWAWILGLVGLLVAVAAALGGYIIGRRVGASAAIRAASGIPAAGIRYAHGQAQGARERQEDDFGQIVGDGLDPEGRHTVLVVADGMGGHAAGDVASRLAVKAFIESYGEQGPVRDRLREALDRANEAIARDLREDWSHAGMGTTLVAAAVTSEGLHWISVGDSALYLFRSGRIERLNEDHSMRPVIARWQEKDPDFAATLNPNELQSVVMGREISQTDLPDKPRRLRAGDIVLLATDGLETLSDGEIAEVVAGSRDGGPPAIRSGLLEAVDAAEHPYQDNTTLYVAEIGEDSTGATREEADPGLEADTEPPDRAPDEGESADQEETR